MIGLTHGDNLELSKVQAVSLALNTLVLCVWFVFRSEIAVNLYILSSFCFVCLSIAFRNELISIDNQILWKECQRLQGLSWEEFLLTFHRRPYLEWQSPFIPFILSRACGFPKVVSFASKLLGMGTLILFIYHFGAVAALLFAAPAVALLLLPPSTDLPMLFCIILSFALVDIHQYYLAAFTFALSLILKPLGLVLLPFFIFAPPALILSVFFYIPYLLWALRYDFGKKQFDFLLNQCLVSCLPKFCEIGDARRKKTGKPKPTWKQWIRYSLAWRWIHVTRPALSSLPVYFAPVLLGVQHFQWQGVVLSGIIFVGYSNVKYYVLALLLLF